MELPAAPSVMVLEGLAAAAEKAQAPLTAGLRGFQVVPNSPGGTQMTADKMELFDHIVRLVRGILRSTRPSFARAASLTCRSTTSERWSSLAAP